MPKVRTKAFTLIELMIVVAIIGILAAIAIPMYLDYTARAQAAEAVDLLAGLKTPLTEHYAKGTGWPASAASVAGVLSGEYTEQVVITNGAGSTSLGLLLTATMRATGVTGPLRGTTVLLSTPDGGKTWNCQRGTIDAKYLPASCR